MARRLDSIDARIAEVEKLRRAEDAREQRILEVAAGIYAEQEKTGLGPLEPLLEQMKLDSGEIERFFKSQEEVARRRLEMATPQLQLTEDEIELLDTEERAVLLIDPCTWVHSSPGWECAHYASSCGSGRSETGSASASCTCHVAANRCEPKVGAYGYGSKGRSSAYLHSFCYFDIPARPAPATVDVYTLVRMDGFYVVRPSAGSASFTLDLEMRGYQYGWSWASAHSSVLSLSGDTMGRFDETRSLHFVMPVGADPFVVRVSARLKAYAKRGGAFAVGDFASGAGNYIRTHWVNTYSP